MMSNKKGSSSQLPPDTTTSPIYNNSERVDNQSNVGTTAEDSPKDGRPIISVFHAPVSNTTKFTDVIWEEFFEKLTGSPIILQDNSHKEKAQKGAYFVRGLVDGSRNDDNLGKCSLIIIDVDKPLDGATLPTPEETHAVLKDVTHVVHSSATQGRSRIIFYVPPYDKEKTDELTYAVYSFCMERGLKFAFAGESKTKSQPWFLPQTTEISRHQAYGTVKGKQFNPDMVKGSYSLPTKPLPKPEKTFNRVSDAHNSLGDFIDALQSGTIHEAAKKYAGWLRRTSNLTIPQIFDQITLLIDIHCSDPAKIERWHESEGEQLENWFVNNVGDKRESETFSPKDSPEDILRRFEMTTEYADGLGEERWLYDNLIIEGHLLVIIAMPGGGKTSIFFYHVVACLVNQGLKVFYVDADNPASEHKAMKAYANRTGFILICPEINVGTGIPAFLQTVKQMIESGVDLTGHVFIFDTLKKFADLMNKADVKNFLSLCRTMCSRGATCVFLAHANKYRDKEDNLIPEGVGDVKNDADDLIFFERKKKLYGIDVTTIIDVDKGAKTRGIFTPISFHIDQDRQVTKYDRALDLPDKSDTKGRKATTEEILDIADVILFEDGGDICKTDLVKKVYSELVGLAGEQRIKDVLTMNSSVKREGEKSRTRFEYFKGDRNAQMFSRAPER